MVKPSVSAEKGNPSSLLRPNPGEKVEMDPNPIYGEGDHHGHGDKLSAGAILKGDAGHTMPSTPFEMKAALVNRELDKMGLGRYQKAIWLLCMGALPHDYDEIPTIIKIWLIPIYLFFKQVDLVTLWI